MRYARVSHVMYQSCFISDMLNINNSKNQKQLMPIIQISIPASVNHFGDQKCQISIMSMWIVLSINNSMYQSWQVSVIIWSIEWSIRYVSLKSDNITCVEMSYVLANFGYPGSEQKELTLLGRNIKSNELFNLLTIFWSIIFVSNVKKDYLP